jgi:hypothetical protein
MVETRMRILNEFSKFEEFLSRRVKFNFRMQPKLNLTNFSRKTCQPDHLSLHKLHAFETENESLPNDLTTRA